MLTAYAISHHHTHLSTQTYSANIYNHTVHWDVLTDTHSRCSKCSEFYDFLTTFSYYILVFVQRLIKCGLLHIQCWLYIYGGAPLSASLHEAVTPGQRTWTGRCFLPQHATCMQPSVCSVSQLASRGALCMQCCFMGQHSLGEWGSTCLRREEGNYMPGGGGY